MMDVRTSKYSGEHIIGFLGQAETGMPVKEIGRKHFVWCQRSQRRRFGMPIVHWTAAFSLISNV
jgi:hypothetical protein